MSSRHDTTLFDLIRGQRRRYGLSVLAMGAAAACTFVAPFLVGRAIDVVAAPAETRALAAALEAGLSERFGWTPAAAALVLCALLGILATALAGALQYVSGRNAALASESIVRLLRERLYARLEALPISFHDSAETGDLVQRCTSDVETIRVFLAAQVVEIGRAILLFLCALPILLLVSPPMTAVALGVVPFIVAFAFYFFREIKRLFLAQDEAEGALTTVLQENLTGIRVVRAFARQEHECQRFGAQNAAFRDRTRRLISTLGTYWAASDLLCLLQIGVVLLIGAGWVAEGRLTIGELNTFLMAQALVLWPMRQLGRILNDSGRAVVALGRTRGVLDEEAEAAPAGPDHDLVPAAHAPRGEIRFEHVDFAYADGRLALEDVSLHAAPGEVLALVGPPGSGKSTVVQLLCKLYEPTRGQIRFDGRALALLSHTEIRRAVGVVLQEPFLYSKTVRQNLLVGRAAASEEELVHAATSAAIHASLETFDEGYDTLVGERGVTLSGGQRQRVAIARALLKDPAVLVLDDALSAVDTRTEGRILAELDARRGERTTLLVTHRLASVVHADRIYVFDDGRVVESGTHAQLVARPGPYQRLWRIQHALEDELETDLHPIEETA